MMQALVSRDRLLRLLAVALVAAGLGVGAYFAVQAAGSDGSSQTVAEPTETSAPAALSPPQSLSPPADIAPTPTPVPPTPVPPPSVAPLPTAVPPPPTSFPTPLPEPDITFDEMIAAGLPSADQVQLGPDSKYFIADYLGCRWVEHFRMTIPDIGESVTLRASCSAGFQIEFRPETGEIFGIIP